jgi:hypothetical protein
MDAFYAVPAVALLVVVIVLAVIVGAGGQLVVHRRFPSRDFVAHNEVGGIMITVSGTIYAVLLGFMTVVAWQHHEEARELVVAESDADIDAWHTAVGLPAPVRHHIRSDMTAYANTMVTREWPAMQRGDFDPDAALIGMDAIEATATAAPRNEQESNAQNATMQQLTIMHDARQRRIASNDSGVTWFEWVVLLVGAAGITGFCWLFGMHNRRTHVLMTAIVVGMIASVLVLLFELQYPFRGDIGIGPGAWQAAAAHIRQMQTAKQTDMRM